MRKPPAPALLPKLRAIVAAAEPFDAATLKAGVEAFAAAEGVKPGPVSQMLRVATIGTDSPAKYGNFSWTMYYSGISVPAGCTFNPKTMVGGLLAAC